MERRNRLILDSFLLLAVNCSVSPKVGRLVIRSNDENEESVIIKDRCQCDPNTEMKFSISSSLLPEIDFDADTSEINFDFHGATAGCDGQIEFNAQRELDVTFKIDPSCGVYFNQGQLPEYVAEEFTGKRMETTINLMYLGSRQKEQFVSAHLTCVCPGTSTDVMCNEGKFIYNETILCGDQDQPLCDSIKLVGGSDLSKTCGLKIEEYQDQVRIHGEVSLLPRDRNDFGTDSYECEILEDKGEYVKIRFQKESKTLMTIGTIGTVPLEKTDDFEHSCLKPATWTNFGAWSACTHTCHPVVAGGCPRMVRRRYCDNGAVGFPGCDGEELESKPCENLKPCESPCPGKTVLNGNKDGCEFNDGHNVFVLLPHNIWSSLNEIDPTSSKTITFNPNPDSKSSLAILRKEGEKLNFELVTGKPGVTWAIDGQSLNVADPNFTTLNGQDGFLKVKDKDSGMEFEIQEVSPFNPKWVENQVLEDVFWSGAYEHIIFVNSKTSFSGKKNSFISEYHILAKPINADILSWQMLSVLNDENVWAPSSSPIPSAQPDFSPTCKSGFDECSIADLSQPECDSGTCTAEMMKNGVNPCELTGTFKGFVSFTAPQECGQCTGCNQIKLSCSSIGVPEWTTPSCETTKCQPCNETEKNTFLPQWSEWSACSNTCSEGKRSRTRADLENKQKVEIIEKATCLLSFDDYKTTDEENCNEQEPQRCPVSKTLNCGKEKDTCESCSDTLNATCTFDDSNGCKTECFTDLSCQKECCDSDLIEEDTDECEVSNDCIIGYFKKSIKTKCEKKFEVKTEPGKTVCQKKNEKPGCTCLPNDTNHFECSTLSATELSNQVCKSREENGQQIFQKVSGHCKVKPGFENIEQCKEYDEFIDCIAPICDETVKTNCCSAPVCPKNGLCTVDQICKDSNGADFTKPFDCCEGEENCDADQIEDCKPCESSHLDTTKCGSQKIECPSHNCTINMSQCQICQEKFCEEIAGDEIKIFELNQKSMADLRLSLPVDLYTNKLRFIIGKPTSFNIPGCFVDYDQSSNIAVDLKFDRKDLVNCDVDSVPTDTSNLKANVYVDKMESQKNSISTHTPFLKIDCSYKPTKVEKTLEVIQNRDPLTFSGVIPGEVDITLEMSAKPDFSTLLSEDENVVLVGDLLYARIRGDQDFKITSCHVMDANHISGSQHKYQLLDDGCPAEDDLVKLFKFGFLPTSEKFTKIFKWQNFIFRDGAPNQRLVYQCVVQACHSDCEQTCSNNQGTSRKRRETELKSRLSQATNFYFFMEVYETRKMLEQALRERRNDYSKELLVTVVSSILLLGLAAGMAIYLLLPRSKDPDRRPYSDLVHAQLRSLLENRVKPALNPGRKVQPPPPYPNNPTLKADEYARALQGGHLVDDPNFIVNSLSPKIFVRNNNDED